MAGFHILATMTSYLGGSRWATFIPERQQTMNETIMDATRRSYTLTNMKPWSKYKIVLKVFNEDKLPSLESTAYLQTPEGGQFFKHFENNPS